MPPKPPAVDPADGLIIDEVGPWASEKHERLKRYIDASRGARAKFLPPRGEGASYIDLFSGPGRSLIKDTSQIIDGSPLVSYKAGVSSSARFSEVHLGDMNDDKLNVVTQRLRSLGGSPVSYVGAAETVVDRVLYALNPRGLHFAFLDPYNLAQLPFSIIEKLLTVKRMDMVIHVSLQDLQRNLDDYSREGDRTLDNFAPGWRGAIDVNQAIAPLRAALIEYWLQKIRNLGSRPATGIPLIVGEKNQRLYWLVFVSSNDLGHHLWNDTQNLGGQGSLF
jgi:three-Cys-motif partner protein